MNIRDLKYIVAVADSGSFSRASEKCFVSQPALSMQVKKLEESIETKIFNRDSKGLSVTPKGSELVAKARAILAQVDEFYQLARESENPLEGNLVLGAFPTLSPYLVPRILPVLMERYSNLEFVVDEEKTGVLIEKLLNSEVDVALIALPVNEKGISGIKVMEEEFYLCVGRDNALFEQESVTYDDLRGQDLLLLEEGHCLRDQALEVCSQVRDKKTKILTSASLETLVGMVASGMGVTLVPEMASDLHPGTVNYLPFRVNEPGRKIALCWKQGSPRETLYQHLAHSLISLQL